MVKVVIKGMFKKKNEFGKWMGTEKIGELYAQPRITPKGIEIKITDQKLSKKFKRFFEEEVVEDE